MSEVERTVIVYSTPTCPYCRQAKEYLTQNGIAYTECNVAIDMTAREEMKQKSSQAGVPVIDVDGTVVIGFNRTMLDGLLGL